MSKIGILGGTFNPIHIGHMILAQYAYEFANLDEIWIMPTGFSYLKKDDPVPSGEIRLQMVEKAVEDIPYMHASDVEVKREGCTYTYETLEYLKQEFPQNEYYFIVGADCLFFIDKWKNSKRLFDACTLIAALRGDVSEEEMEHKCKELSENYQAKVMLMPFKQIDISSTEIRKRIHEKKSAKFMVPDKVLWFIEENELYKCI